MSKPANQRKAFIQKNLLDNEFYRGLWKQFDKGLATSLDSFNRQVSVSVGKIEKRIKACEVNLTKLVIQRQKFFEKELVVAETLVNKELRSKVIIAQWTNQFLSISDGKENIAPKEPDMGSPNASNNKQQLSSPTRRGKKEIRKPPPAPPTAAFRQNVLDPITFAIIRFALNITLNYRDVNLDFILYTGIHKNLIHFISLTDTYMIIGPALMALNHIVLINNEIKHILVCEGILQKLLVLMTSSKLSNKVILSLCAKLCASLALEQLNKTSIAKSGVFHVLFDLILGAHCDINEMIQYYAITAILNTIYKNEINRKYAIELSGIKPILTAIRTTSDNKLMAQAMHALANIAYSNAFTANCILVEGGGEILAEIVAITDILGPNYFIAESAYSAYSNMCYSETNQTHIGNVEGLLDTTVRICENARIVSLINQVALFLVGLTWQNYINKSRVANCDGCMTLTRQIVRLSSLAMAIQINPNVPNNPNIPAPSLTPEEMDLLQKKQDLLTCIDNLAIALASVLLYPLTHERMIADNGLDEIIRVCKITNEPSILKSLSKVLVTMVPNPRELLIVHKDKNRHVVERLNVLAILKKVLLTGFADVARAPDWLETVMDVLNMMDKDLAVAPDIPRREFIDKLHYCKEFYTDIYPDADIYQRQEFRGYIFSIY